MTFFLGQWNPRLRYTSFRNVLTTPNSSLLKNYFIQLYNKFNIHTMLTIATDMLVLITYAFAIPITSEVPQSGEIQLMYTVKK